MTPCNLVGTIISKERVSPHGTEILSF